MRPDPVQRVRPLLHHLPVAPGLCLHHGGRGPGRLLLQAHAMGPTHYSEHGQARDLRLLPDVQQDVTVAFRPGRRSKTLLLLT